MHLRRNPAATRRRGVILLVVLAMLTLFAIAGITFVLYANAASESARISRDAETLATDGGEADMDPSASLNLFMSQLVYGVDDNSTQYVESALRGHSLAETMYGSWDSQPTTTPSQNYPSDVPFSGTGRLHETIAQEGIDGYNMVNYTYYPTDNFLRDPSCLGARANQNANRGTYTGGQNAPYTYPDLNNMFLAAIRASDGMVIQPSYHRDYTGAGGFGTLDPSNTNWYNGATGKYLTLRPRPAEMNPPGTPPGTGFTAPTSNSTAFPNSNSVIPAADVKNLTGSPGGNDSIWIDIGAPIMTTASGQEYKMLVAPLILDLDNRINLNVVGNILASNGHASNQGWGQWEVNLGTVLNASSAPTEWQKLFIGNGQTSGRYGADSVPSATFNTSSGPFPHAYAQSDFDAMQNPRSNGVTSTPYSLPATGGGFFPTFTGAYGNYSAQETSNHPMFFNLFTPVGDDKLFQLKSHASLMWAGVSASPGSELVTLSPTNFSAADPTTISRIHQTTLLSMDPDRPGASPYIYDASNAYNVAFSVTAPGNASYTSTGVTAQTFPSISPSRQAAPGKPGEFDPVTWRSTLAATLSRINLNRTLAAYPTAGPTAGQQPADREQFANDIFWRLVNVTGMQAYYTPNADTTQPGTLNGASATQYATLRWLAQLSANVVDFIDTDDVMTAFHWTSSVQGTDNGYVFGTELPKLVVNEVYLEYDNDSQDPGMVTNPNPPPPMTKGATKAYHMNVWTELLNPLPSTNDANGANNANLMVNNQPAYQIVITTPNKDLRNAANLVGDPDGATPGNPPFASQPYNGTGSYSSSTTGGQVLAVVNSWGSANNVAPVGTAQSGAAGSPPANGSVAGFLVIGPNDPQGPQGGPPTAQVQMQNSLTVAANDQTGKGMTYSVPNVTTDPNVDNPLPPTILLQRLANPNLPFNGTPGGATYNPWVTVDYVDMQQVGTATGKKVVNDARQYNSQGTNPNWTANNNAVQTLTNRYSFGRNQPYGAVETSAEWQQQTAGAPANPAFTQPVTTTFFDVNTPANPAAPPDWLVHLDRPLISPAELLNVSGFKPHELTQQFYKDASGNFQHVAPWTKETYLLYRLLEFVKTNNGTPGIVDGGRVPGKININTIDSSYLQSGQVSPVFQALCDAQAGNTFNTTDVQNAYNALMNARTASGTGVPGPTDKPFWSLAEGLSTGTNTQPGLAQTLLNTSLQNPTLNNMQATHPYQKMELLNKIFNNLTTRSNTFAVWLTVGFFPVINDTVQPNQLGPEINLSNGRNIRHHMFAIVDRTQIMTFGNPVSTGTGAIHYSGPPITAGTPTAIGIPTSITNTASHTFQLQAGSSLVYDPGVFNQSATGAGPDPNQPNEETVIVQAGGTATFKYPHNNGANVISRGHPGPMPASYTAATDTAVIPYLVIID